MNDALEYCLKLCTSIELHISKLCKHEAKVFDRIMVEYSDKICKVIKFYFEDDSQSLINKYILS